ncbi:RNA polymerase II transcription factor B subunit 1 [Podochytrium sp. JEL0797]|nr:RNA polymerase II transcription factor B subunit 1 [Podochytrium sp. JEL0797]
MFAVQLNKKGGSLTLTGAGVVVFTAQNAADSVSVSVADIASQAANVVGEKAKRVLLRVALTQGRGALAFAFVGADALGDRQRFSERLNTALALSRPQPTTLLTSHDIAIRRALLKDPKNKELQRLHTDLCIGGTISEDDFWASRKELLVNQDWKSGMKTGKSSSLLVDVVRAAAGGSSTSANAENDSEKQDPQQPAENKFTFTPEIIHSIFVNSPAVRLAYERNVPEKISEKEFWTKYYASKAFHALKAGKSTSGDLSEIYSALESEIDDDSLPIPKKPRKDTSNKLLDLSSTSEDHLEYGNAPDTTMRPGSYRASLPIIRRLNRHSTIILESAGETVYQTPSAILQNETVMEDLLPRQTHPTRPLTILQDSNYFGGIEETAASSFESSGGVEAPSLNAWVPNLMGSVAVLFITRYAYEQVSVNPVRAGKVMKSLNNASLKRKLTILTCKDNAAPIREDILQFQSSANELLRHYWAFHTRFAKLAPGSPDAPVVREKLDKLLNAVSKVYSNVMEFQDALGRQGGGSGEEGLLLEGVKKAMVSLFQAPVAAAGAV